MVNLFRGDSIMLKNQFKPEDDDSIKTWGKNGITWDIIYKGLSNHIHPIHWVKESVVQDLLNEFTLRVCYSIDRKYYKINYGNATFNDFLKYPFLYYCRGDVLRTESDLIVHKAVNKIWNINENPLTQDSNIQWRTNTNSTPSFITIEKMDGMLIVPYKDDNSNWKLTSRGSFEFDIIPVAEKYFNEKYIEFCEQYSKAGYYPVFEIISPQSFIKVEYPPEKHGLYYLGCADIYGELQGWQLYSSFKEAQSLGIKTPESYSVYTQEDLIKFVNSFDKYYDFEGVVITFLDGRGSLKIKSNKYFEMNIQKLDNIEHIYELWNDNEIDDVIAHIPPLLSAKITDTVEKFKLYKSELVAEYQKILPYLEKQPDQKSVVAYIQSNCKPKYFHFFINKWKNNIQAIERNRKNLILHQFESNS